MADPRIIEHGATYEVWQLPDGRQAIYCVHCRRMSDDSTDVSRLFCSCCHRWHLHPDVPERPCPHNDLPPAEYRRARGVIPYDPAHEKPEDSIRRMRDDW